MTCKICNDDSIYLFKLKILNKYNVQYYRCPNCYFVQTEEPYWLNEAYNTPINLTDTGLLSRNIRFSRILSVILTLHFNKKSKYLDYAGGYGIFTRLMRDFGFDFYWYDPYTENLVAKGFEGNTEEHYEVITLFETFEHFVNPIKEIESLFKVSDNILFSTLLVPENPNIDWWYFGTEHGQHVALYHQSTLEFIAKKYQLNYYHFFDVHMFTKRKFHPLQIKLIKLLCNELLFNFVKRWFKSMIFSDSVRLKNQLKNN